jgi:hypothetical protein
MPTEHASSHHERICVGHIAFFLYGEGIHVGTLHQSPTGLFSSQHTYNTGLSDMTDFQAQLDKVVEDNSGSSIFFKSYFGMLVKILTQLD